MALTLVPHEDPLHPVPTTPEGKQPLRDLKETVQAAANTVNLLSDHGLELNMTSDDNTVAQKVAMSYAENPERTSKVATPERVGKLTPASLLLTDKILREFGHRVVESGVQLRYLVTNKLIEETENPDARIRIRALELLGKISDVGLFAEKSEITITHQTSDDLREKLREKLQKLVDVQAVDADIIDGEAEELRTLNVDAEFGLDVDDTALEEPHEEEDE